MFNLTVQWKLLEITLIKQKIFVCQVISQKASTTSTVTPDTK